MKHIQVYSKLIPSHRVCSVWCDEVVENSWSWELKIKGFIVSIVSKDHSTLKVVSVEDTAVLA